MAFPTYRRPGSRLRRVSKGLKRARRLRRYKRINRKYRTGFLKVVRKLPVITMSNITGVAGAMQTTDPTGTCLLIGTPVAKTGYTGVYDIPFSLKFELNQLVNYGEFTTIADQYKIQSALIKLESPYNVAQAPGGSATPLPYLEYIQDYDDNGVPNTLTFREKMGIKTKFINASKPMFKLGVRPKLSMLAYQTGVSNGYTVPNRNPWINCSDDDVPHYGIKGVLRNVWIPAVVNGSPFTFDISTKVLFKDIQ